MGANLEVTEIVRPLVSASPHCLENCEGLYTEWTEAFHESATQGTGVMVVFCDKGTACAGSEPCEANTLLVGHVHGETFVPFSNPIIDNPIVEAMVEAVIAMDTQAKPGMVAPSFADEAADRLNGLSVAITRFGIAPDYP